MKFHQIFLASLFEPRKLAAFRLLPIGRTFMYVFLFVTVFTVISFSRFFIGDAILFEHSPDLAAHSEKIGSLIYPIAFILQLVISVFYIFARISIFAYLGTFILTFIKRRHDYLQIWRTSAVAMTVPIILTLVFDFFPQMNSYSLVITSIIHLIYIAAATKYYPKLPVSN